ncbi:MAG TPA: hydroxyisourate hydrolase [Ferruginibacter sp.]|nr:hydroxyisourate hydrolase [Ferruginibacter sp.]
MTINAFNKLNKTAKTRLLASCCGSNNWVQQMMKHPAFKNETQLVDVAVNAWYNQCSSADWLESFLHHPKIGDVKSITKKFAGKEQASVTTASAITIKALVNANKDYELKNGFIFIVCATGKSATEMLQLLENRLSNTIGEELHIAMGEQMKITILRLQQLISSGNWSDLKSSQLTTHVLDTSIGKPGKNISICLQMPVNGRWQSIAQGITNADGRIGDLLPSQKILSAGDYKLIFDIKNYFASQKLKSFYPEVEIQFTITDDSHYHVPLLINPFGFSTYRGS